MGIGSHILWYNHPATEWTEALPIGNGSLGGMVFGGVEKETVGLNLDTLWSGYAHCHTVEDKIENFKEIKKLVSEGKCAEVNEYTPNNFVGDDCQWYMQAGLLKITSMENQCAKTYRRSLNIETAVSTVDYTANETDYHREVFVSHPHKVMIYKFTANGKKMLDFKAMIDCEPKHTVKTQLGSYILDGIAPTHIDNDEDNNAIMTYEDGEKQGLSFRIMFNVVTDGKVEEKKEYLHIKDAREAVIYLTAEDNFEAWDKLPCNSEKDYKAICNKRIEEAVKAGYEEVKAQHVADYQSYYKRVSIDLGESKKDNVPTNRRLQEFMLNKNNDNDLYCLLFNYGRYLTIAGSREDSQAMTLQGIWTFRMCSPWRSNYTVNINTQMNYWPTLSCSLPELYKPLISFITELGESGKEVAEKFYGVSGTCAHHNIDLWRIATPSKGNACWSFWNMSENWFCRHLYEYYEYTLDKDYLKNTALPVMEECAKFCIDMLIEDKDGYLIFSPSTSPENLYMIGDYECSVSETTYMTMGIIRDLFTNLLKSYDILGIDSELKANVAEKLKKLVPYKIGKDGSLYEWYNDEKGFDKHHRHVSHLYSLFPANLINIDDTPELAQAAIRTLENRGDDGTGWSLGWKINFWAKLRNKDKVIKLIDNQLRYKKPKYRSGGGGTFPNMFDAHPPFQIDGNFGATSGIALALMQSIDNKILILPALPDKWANGHIHGLTAKGGTKVDIDWKDGVLNCLTLEGNGTYEVTYNDVTVTVELDGSKKVVEF